MSRRLLSNRPLLPRVHALMPLLLLAGSSCFVSINDYDASTPPLLAGAGDGGAPETEPVASGGGGARGTGTDTSVSGAGGEVPAAAGAMGVSGPRCGNQEVEDGEDCDDGNRVTEACAYGKQACAVCNSKCHEEPGAISFCGDGSTDAAAGEGCDDGSKNDTGPGSCSDKCAGVQTCGNGKKEGTENCDDGALNGTDNNCDLSCGVPWLVDVAAPNGGNGKSWGTAFNKLETAISAANANHGGQIWVKAGSYAGSTYFRSPLPALKLVANVSIYGGFAGTETALSQRDWKANKTILTSGSHDIELASHVLVDGFHVEKGSANSDYSAGGNNDFVTMGGGIYGENVTDVTLRNLVISENLGFTGGGGLAVTNSSIILRNVWFDANKSTAAGSAALEASGGTLEIYDCRFSNHQGALGSGAISASGTVLTIENTDFIYNTRNYEGTVSLKGLSGASRITNALFFGNTGPLKALAGNVEAAAAVWVHDNTKLTLTNITFYRNDEADMPEHPDVRGGTGTTLTNAFTFHQFDGTPAIGLTPKNSCTAGYGPSTKYPAIVDRDGDGVMEVYLNPLSPCVGSGDNTAADLVGLDWKKLSTQETDCLDSGQIDAGKHYAPISANVGPCAN